MDTFWTTVLQMNRPSFPDIQSREPETPDKKMLMITRKAHGSCWSLADDGVHSILTSVKAVYFIIFNFYYNCKYGCVWWNVYSMVLIRLWILFWYRQRWVLPAYTKDMIKRNHKFTSHVGLLSLNTKVFSIQR